MLKTIKPIKNKVKATIESIQEQYYFSKVSIEKPIFIVGLQGGGLTLVRRILSRSTNTVSVGANTINFPGQDEMQNASHLDLAEEFRLFYCKFFNDPPFYRGGWMYGTDQYISHFRKEENDFTPQLSENLKTAIKKVIIKHAINYDSVRFIDKSQSYGLKIPLINTILEKEEPKFVVITRNPYTSILKAIHKPALSMQEALTTEQKIELACQHYKNTFEEILRSKERYDNVFIGKFEDFLENPESWVEQTCSWCELPFSPKILPQPEDQVQGKWYPIVPNRNNNILEQAPSEHIQIINEKLGQLIEILGYSRQ